MAAYYSMMKRKQSFVEEDDKKKLKNIRIISIILIHMLIILSILLYLVLSGKDYQYLLLIDDGYYDLGKAFTNGEQISNRFLGPVLPLIYSVLFIFPYSLHPFLRLMISFIFSIGVIIILYQISKKYISEKQFFWGSLLFILNPIYNHWIVKSVPEIFLAFFLGVFIFTFVNYYITKQIKFIIIALFIFSMSVYLKPSFLVIPFVLIIISLFLKSKRIIIASLLLIILSTSNYIVFNKFTSYKYDNEIAKSDRRIYGVGSLIYDSFWTDYVLKTKQFHKGTIKKYNAPKGKNNKYPFGGSIDDIENQTSKKWIKNFFSKYPNSNYLFMNLYFVYSKPLLVLQKILLSPLFYFSMSPTLKETLLSLIISFFSIFLSFLGLKTILKNSRVKYEILLILSIIFGYILLHLLTHAYSRYSLPVLPYLYIWGGIAILRIKEKVFPKLQNKNF